MIEINKFKHDDILEVTSGKIFEHFFEIGSICKVLMIKKDPVYGSYRYLCETEKENCRATGKTQWIHEEDLNKFNYKLNYFLMEYNN
ncbi:MAG: hypothetical protein ACOC1O_02585 [bacterium]